MTKPILIGCDPEFFLFDTKTDRYTSAHNLVPGDKANPYKLECGVGAVQADGTAVEFNITPVETFDEFQHNINAVLKDIKKIVPSRYEFRFVPSVFYQLNYFESIPKKALELGCEPDYNARTGDPNPRPDTTFMPTLRTGAGHIHIGWTEGMDPHEENHFKDCCALVLELYDNVNLGLFDRDMDRRNLYGNGPVFRPKSYGVEFRTPSNAWLNSDRAMRYVFNQSRQSFLYLAEMDEKRVVNF